MASYIILGIIILSFIVNDMVGKPIKEMQKKSIPASLSGDDIAQKILEMNNVTDVTIKKTEKSGDDLYHPVMKYIQFGPDIHGIKTVYSMAIGAHEACHAVDYQVYRLLFLYVDKIVKFVFFPLFIASFFLHYHWMQTTLSWLYVLIFIFKCLIIVRDEIKTNNLAHSHLKKMNKISKTELDESRKLYNYMSLTYITSAPLIFFY